MKKNTKRIARNLHTFAKAEITRALNKYYAINDPETMKIKFAICTQKWSDLSQDNKQYFVDKAILILTR